MDAKVDWENRKSITSSPFVKIPIILGRFSPELDIRNGDDLIQAFYGLIFSEIWRDLAISLECYGIYVRRLVDAIQLPTADTADTKSSLQVDKHSKEEIERVIQRAMALWELRSRPNEQHLSFPDLVQVLLQQFKIYQHPKAFFSVVLDVVKQNSWNEHITGWLLYFRSEVIHAQEEVKDTSLQEIGDFVVSFMTVLYPGLAGLFPWDRSLLVGMIRQISVVLSYIALLHSNPELIKTTLDRLWDTNGPIVKADTRWKLPTLQPLQRLMRHICEGTLAINTVIRFLDEVGEDVYVDGVSIFTIIKYPESHLFLEWLKPTDDRGRDKALIFLNIESYYFRLMRDMQPTPGAGDAKLNYEFEVQEQATKILNNYYRTHIPKEPINEPSVPSSGSTELDTTTSLGDEPLSPDRQLFYVPIEHNVQAKSLK